jgi:ATP-dependent protease ClpP protease subunit
VAQAKLIAKDLQASTILQIKDAMQDGFIEEICHDCKQKN